jgi:hypothetical protein
MVRPTVLGRSHCLCWHPVLPACGLLGSVQAALGSRAVVRQCARSARQAGWSQTQMADPLASTALSMSVHSISSVPVTADLLCRQRRTAGAKGSTRLASWQLAVCLSGSSGPTQHSRWVYQLVGCMSTLVACWGAECMWEWLGWMLGWVTKQAAGTLGWSRTAVCRGAAAAALVCAATLKGGCD